MAELEGRARDKMAMTTSSLLNLVPRGLVSNRQLQCVAPQCVAPQCVAPQRVLYLVGGGVQGCDMSHIERGNSRSLPTCA